jgi:hypothetical protein
MLDEKPGYKSTEFWMSAAVAIIGLVIASGAVEDTSTWGQILAYAMSTLTTLGYTAGRAKVKSS